MHSAITRAVGAILSRVDGGFYVAGDIPLPSRNFVQRRSAFGFIHGDGRDICGRDGRFKQPFARGLGKDASPRAELDGRFTTPRNCGS